MGRPKGSLNKPKKVAKPVKTSTRITQVAPQNPEDPAKANCCACGKQYTNLNINYFPKAQSAIWEGRGYFLPICKTCLENVYSHYVEAYGGDERKAIRRICMMFDLYYSDAIYEASEKVDSRRSRITSYISRSNLRQYRDPSGIPKTYDNTIDEEKGNQGSPFADIVSEEDMEKAPTFRVTKAAYERWGGGIFETDEYRILEEHYQTLHKNNPNIDSNQEIFVKRLCHLQLMMIQSMKEKNFDLYNKNSREYSKTFQEAGLKTVAETDASNNEVFGVTLSLISQLTPEEFYSDRTLYRDYDAIGEYFDRHVKRPMENLMTGSDVRDKEYFVPEEDDADE